MPKENRTKPTYIKGKIHHNVPVKFLRKSIQVTARIINQKDPIGGIRSKLLITSSPQKYLLVVPPGKWEICATIDGQGPQRQTVTVEEGQTAEVNFSFD